MRPHQLQESIISSESRPGKPAGKLAWAPKTKQYASDKRDRAEIDLGVRIRRRVAPCAGSDVLLRKEVIQPHLPIRLPCYDFTPITDPTLGGCPPCGLAHRLWVLPAFVV